MAYFKSEQNNFANPAGGSSFIARAIEPQVYLVGAGPGAADLLTLRAVKLLQQARYVFYDALVSEEILTLCPQATLVAVGKRSGRKSTAQESINQQLSQAAISAAKVGGYVVRLKGGDPMLFGRAEEEISALEQQHIKVAVVPGITAALAASATLKQSLTQRKIARSVAFLTFSTADPGEVVLPAVADTLVIYMGKKMAIDLAQRLLTEPPFWAPTTPVVLLAAVSSSEEKYQSYTLADIIEGKAYDFLNTDAPLLMLVGEVFAKVLQQQGSSAIENAWSSALLAS